MYQVNKLDATNIFYLINEYLKTNRVFIKDYFVLDIKFNLVEIKSFSEKTLRFYCVVNCQGFYINYLDLKEYLLNKSDTSFIHLETKISKQCKPKFTHL